MSNERRNSENLSYLPGMKEKLKEIVIPKERALFWLDKNGRWHNDHGEFKHKKIIDYFLSSIKRDKNGYYLGQRREGCTEKVYFCYEDTALFVVDLVIAKDIVLVLNTKKELKLRPRNLFIKNDNLYMKRGEETIKFSERGLMRISDFLQYDNNQYFIEVKSRKYKINQL